MKTISRNALLQLAAERGITPDPRYPHSEHLFFQDNPGEFRYWEYPEEAARLPHFINAVVKAMGGEQRHWLYPVGGSWSLGDDAEAWPQYRIWKTLLRSMGIADDFTGAVAVDREERDLLLAFLFLQTLLGPFVYIDSFLIPDTGNGLLFFEHHKVVHMQFRNSERLRTAVDLMETEGYPLPIEPPDETFKSITWTK